MVEAKKPTTRKTPAKKPVAKTKTLKEPVFEELLATDGGEGLADIMQSLDFLEFVEEAQKGDDGSFLQQMIQAKNLLQGIYSPEGFKQLNDYFMEKEGKKGVLFDMFEWTTKKLTESTVSDSKE